MNRNEDDKKLDWMYKGATSLVDREEYLLGRSVDKPLENLNQEERDKKLGIVPPKNHVEHECIPPSIRDFNKIVQAEQVDLSAKLQEDPLMAIKKREEEARRQFLQNPIQLKKLQEALKSQDQKKKKKKKRKTTDSDLNQKITEKLKYLKHNPLTKQLVNKSKKQPKDDSLDIILMHKYNQLKDSLSQEDLDDILAGRISSSSDSENSEKSRRKNDTKRKLKPNEDIKETKRQPASRRRNINEYNSDNQDKDIPRAKRYKEENKRLRKDSNEYSNTRLKHINESKKEDSRKKMDNTSKRRNRKSTSEEDSSSEDESHKTKRKYTVANQPDKKFKHTKSKKRQSDSSDSEDERTKKKSKYTSRNHKSKYDSESSGSDRKPKKKNLKSNKYQKNKKKHSSSSSSESEDKPKNIETPQEDPLDQMILKKLHMLRDNALSNKTDKAVLYSHYDSDNDKPVYKVKSFGLIKADGTKIPLKEKPLRLEEKPIEPKVPQKEMFVKKRAKRLTSEEKEELRRQMMKDAEVREKERSSNLRKYREDNKKEEIERNTSEFDKSFVHKELLKSTKSATVESRIKSNLNNIQRSSRHMSTNFSKRT